jgi:hypothetical protein
MTRTCSPRADVPADDGRGDRTSDRRVRHFQPPTGTEPGRPDLHRQPVQRRGLHPAGVRQPDARHARRRVGSANDGATSGRTARHVPRSVHQVRCVPPRDHQAARRRTDRRDPRPRRARRPHPHPPGVGIAITELTSLLARRSVYCSKWANGKHSIAKSFDDRGRQHLVRAHGAHLGRWEAGLRADTDQRGIPSRSPTASAVLRCQQAALTEAW